MSLTKVSEALSKLAGNSEMAQALNGVIAAQKGEGTDILVEEVCKRLTDVMAKRKEGASNADLEAIVKSSAGLLAVAAGVGEIRVMTRTEFEEYAVEQIGKSSEGGSTAADLTTLRASIEAAAVLFAGEGVSKSFAFPVVVAKEETPAADETAEAGEEAPAAEAVAAGEETPAVEAGEAAEKSDDAAESAEAAPAGDEATGETAEASGEGEGGEAVDTAKGLAEEAEFDGWPSDMNSKAFMNGEKAEEPAFGKDPAAPAAE